MLEHLVQDVKEHSLSYGGIPFWSWNGKLEEDELRRQIRNMHDLHMNGFFMHARSGLKTEYLSKEWFDCVRTCIKKSKDNNSCISFNNCSNCNCWCSNAHWRYE